jgi:hypothetical protein
MKHLYTLALFLAFFSLKAQNWQSVYSDRLVYFDSSRQAIKIVSTAVDSTGDSTFKNYPQLFVDSFGNNWGFNGRVVDSTSWIGKRIYIKTNGYNGFVNDSNETVWLNTQANLNDTFTFLENKRVLIKAYCNKVFYGDTFGITDSIKQFKFIVSLKKGIKYYYDTIRVKNFVLLLSKHHGLLQTPTYSNRSNGYYEMWMFEKMYQYSPKNYFTNRRFNTLDIDDEYEFEIRNTISSRNHTNDRYYFKVIKIKPLVGTDSVDYTFLVRIHHANSYKKEIPPYGPSNWYWETVIKHEVFETKKVLLVNDEPFNGWLPGQLYRRDFSYSLKQFQIVDSCNFSVFDFFYGEIWDTVNHIFYPPFESNRGIDYYSRIGGLSWSLQDNGSGGSEGYDYTITYKNFCNTIYGEPFAKIYVYGVGVNEIEKDAVSLYPNPAQNIVNITASQIQSVSFFDINGKEINVKYTTDTGSITADVSALTAGIYLVSVETTQGKSVQKLLVNH